MDRDRNTDEVASDHEELSVGNPFLRTAGAAYRNNGHSPPEIRHERSWRNIGFGAQSYKKNFHWSRSSKKHTTAPTGSWRNVNSESSGGARPKECNAFWRRNHEEKAEDTQETSTPRRSADSQGEELGVEQPSNTAAGISRDFFRRPGKVSHNGESTACTPSLSIPGEETKWHRGRSSICSDLGKYTDQVQVRQNPETPPMSEEELKTLLQESPSELLSKLLSKKDAWFALLNQNSFNDSVVKLTLSVLSCICDLNVDPQVKQDVHMVFSVIESSGFLSKHLTRYLVCLSIKQPQDQDAKNGENLVTNINLILQFIQAFLVHKPEFYGEVGVVLILLEKVVSLLESDCADHEPKGNNYMIQVQQLKECYHSLDKARQTKQQIKVQQPPNNFRDIPIFPQSSEIRTPTKPFLRKNIIEGRYQDVEHYLDVQFRLLREDFVAPLREGITEFLSAANSRHQHIRVYRNVSIQGNTLAFDVKDLKRMNWETSKRLMYGSLLCLTNDNFQSILCASVAYRNIKNLEKGLVDVCFLTRTKGIPSGRFVMVESAAYFEAYRHVLLGLQRMESDNFPFERYIVNVSSNVKIPRYLSENCSDVYDLRSLAIDPVNDLGDVGETGRSKNAACVPILEPQSWPTARALHLDESQKAALQAALTKEFAIIQGPPGTGKTHLGLKIIELLLCNIKTTSPVLVVCHTNHALDQFLEGVLHFGERHLVRVGGQSNSDALKSRNLSYLKRTPRNHRSSSLEHMEELNEITKKLSETKATIHCTLLKAAFAKTVIFSVETLKHFMCDKHQQCFKNQGKDGDPTKTLLNWLNVYIEHESDSSDLSDSNEENDELIDVDDEAIRIQHERRIDDDVNSRISDKQRKDHELYVLKKCAAYSIKCKTRCGSNLESTPNEEIKKADMMTDGEASGVRNLWSLKMSDRWRLYKLWLRRQDERLEELMTEYRQSYDSLSKEIEVLNATKDLEILSKATVIGMTTTGAAKFRSVLQLLSPRIVIVEEAAEVLEAYIITALTAKCQHLILIGDHQQLKPNPTVYRLAKVFNLDTSLFERMINNGVSYQTLTHQHRMRPEISKLTRKHFYKNLHDDDSVMGFRDIKGVAHNMFFIDHSHLEDGSGNDSNSKSNQYEAEVLVELCRYLLHQGYKSKQITILTTYLGQLFNFKKLMDKKTFEGVRVAVVDNFQGEENDIILLSLVRSNEEDNIGFLKTSNRVCVALSRARMGFYCIGNASILKKTSIWNDIISTLDHEKKICSSIPLVCQNHAEVTRVSSARDFKEKVQDGGCGKPCGYRLPCDHICHLQCHPFDLNHAKYKCTEPCAHLCDREEHACPLKCYKKCRPCSTNVPKAMPDCGHVIQVKCHQFDYITCTEPCPQMLPCGHLCGKMCGESCTTKCTVKVSKHVTKCGHDVLMDCSSNPDLVPCTHPCDEILLCGHRCPKMCKDPCPREKRDDQYKFPRRLDICQQKCEQSLPCGHPCPNMCGYPCPKKSVSSIHSRSFGGILSNVYSTVCKIIVQKQNPKCGHTASVACYTDIASITCQEICNKVLSCGHRCTDKCDVPCKCKLRVNRKLPSCGHSARLPCYQDFYSYKCDKKCQTILPCGHSCSNKCWEPCLTNREDAPSESPGKSPLKTCQRSVRKKFPGCDHSVVLPCSQDIDSIVCPAKCQKMLSCGHKCPNQCGEPCPSSFLRLEEKYTDLIDDSDSSSYLDELYFRNCKQLVKKKIPFCGHVVESPCYKRVESLVCPKPCEKTLPCGHQCTHKCGEPCPGEECTSSDDEEEMNENDFGKQKCQVIVRKQLPVCKHFMNLPCYRKADSAECPKPCEKMLECGHQCPNKCGETCISPEDCDELVEKTLPGCGHKVETHCSGDVKLVICTEKCEKVLPCGHACPNKCKEPCPGEGITATTETRISEFIRRPKVKCDETVKKELPCGHAIKVLCWQASGPTAGCQEPCGHVLGCGHNCPSTCGHCQGVGGKHKVCDTKCGGLLLCGHRCSEMCGHDVCPPHRHCDLSSWAVRENRHTECQHESFNYYCNLPCTEKLHCNHFCIGVCGEPCPPVCRICDKKDVAARYPEGPIRPKDTFIYLRDCGHLCETRFLDEMFAALQPSTTGCVEIRPALCPKCKTPIRKCQRYNHILRTIKDFVDLAKKQCEESHEDARLSFAVGGWMRCPEGHVFCQDAANESEDGVLCVNCTSTSQTNNNFKTFGSGHFISSVNNWQVCFKDLDHERTTQTK